VLKNRQERIVQIVSESASDDLPSLDRVAGTEFLASIELLDVLSLGFRWVEDVMQSQRQWFDGLQKDLTITATQLTTTGPMPALADHVNRRAQAHRALVSRNVANNMTLLEGLLRVHAVSMRVLAENSRCRS
jgi:hypothetical protein